MDSELTDGGHVVAVERVQEQHRHVVLGTPTRMSKSQSEVKCRRSPYLSAVQGDVAGRSNGNLLQVDQRIALGLRGVTTSQNARNQRRSSLWQDSRSERS